MVKKGGNSGPTYIIYRLHVLPVNIPPLRELENTVEQLVIMAKKEEISIHDLPERFLSVSMEEEALESLKQGNNLSEIIESMEKTIIEQAIKENKTTRKTAKVLGITQTSLIRGLKKYNIRNEKE